MPPEMPGAKQWYGSTFGVMPEADWSVDEGGIVRFDDGTVWCFLAERATYSNGYMNYLGTWADWGKLEHMTIWEMYPDRSGWEQMTPDNWGKNDDYQPTGLDWYEHIPDHGSIEQYVFFGYHSFLVLYPDTGGPWVYFFNTDEEFCCRINRDTREFDVINREVDNNALFGSIWQHDYGGITIDENYMWYLSWWQPGSMTHPEYVNRLVRKSLEPPYGDEIVTTWNTENVVFDGKPDPWDRDGSGLPYATYDDVFPAYWGGYAMAHDDDYLYFIYSGREFTDPSEPSQGSGIVQWQERHVSTIKRCSKTAPYTLKTMLWGDFLHSSDRYDPNRGGWGGYGFDQDYGGFPQYTGLVADRNHKSAVRDGWLYWTDAGGEFNTGGSTWSAGTQFRRINLDLLSPDKLLKIDPTDPPFEILSNASANYETHARTNYYAARVTHWREGAYPIHSALGGGSWFFEDDGSIVFVHRELDEIFSEYARVFWPIMRLTPPNSVNNTFQVSLIFEGNALKGYGNVHQNPASYVPPEVLLE